MTLPKRLAYTALLIFLFISCTLVVANWINLGFYYDMFMNGNGYSSKGSLSHIFTRVYHDPNNVTLIKHAFITLFKLSVLFAVAVTCWIVFHQQIRSMFNVYMENGNFMSSRFVKGGLITIALSYGALRAPMTQYLIVLTLCMYMILFIPLLLQLIEGSNRMNMRTISELEAFPHKKDQNRSIDE